MMQQAQRQGRAPEPGSERVPGDEAGAAAPLARCSGQDWLAEAMQCTQYENLSPRSME